LPAYWHPVEAVNALQLQSGIYNFHHPQLLLHLTSLLNAAFQMGDSIRGIVLSGRMVSVVATSVATTAFAVLDARRFGTAFGVVTAGLIGLSPAVFTNAHFFKEDATLLMGVSLTMLALQLAEAEASRKNIVLLGLAAGIAMSAKYVGAVMLVPCVAVLLVRRAPWTSIACCIVCAALVFLLVNSPAIFAMSSFAKGFGAEFVHAITGQGGISWGPARTLINFWHSSTTAILALWICGMALQMRQSLDRHRDKTGTQSGLPTFDALVVVMPLVLLAPIQFSMLPSARYVLPASALAVVAAVWTCASVFQAHQNRVMRFIPAALLAAGCAATLWSFLMTAGIFADDSRMRLMAWISQSLPPDARIAADFFSGLPTSERFAIDPKIQLLPQFVAIPFYHLGSAGSLAALRAQGFTHIVLSSGNFGRFFDPTAKVTGAAALAQKHFYEEVFRHLPPVHDEPLRSNLDFQLTTRLLVYDIR
jgi:4-amino-4-deoxy-L-arabinose transferase-like glycosyltransferase